MTVRRAKMQGSNHLDCFAVQAEMARAMFWRMKANGQVVIGISSYQEFPGQITNPFDDRHTTEADWDIYKATDGWLHCFRWARLLHQKHSSRLAFVVFTTFSSTSTKVIGLLTHPAWFKVQKQAQ